MGDQLTCQELVELVTEYLEGRLSPAARAQFEDHLTMCPPCRNHLDQMQHTVKLLGKLTEESIPSDAKDELLDIFRNWKKR